MEDGGTNNSRFPWSPRRFIICSFAERQITRSTYANIRSFPSLWKMNRFMRYNCCVQLVKFSRRRRFQIYWRLFDSMVTVVHPVYILRYLGYFWNATMYDMPVCWIIVFFFAINSSQYFKMFVSFNIIKLLDNLIYDVTYFNFNLEPCFKIDK